MQKLNERLGDTSKVSPSLFVFYFYHYAPYGYLPRLYGLNTFPLIGGRHNESSRANGIYFAWYVGDDDSAGLFHSSPYILLS